MLARSDTMRTSFAKCRCVEWPGWRAQEASRSDLDPREVRILESRELLRSLNGCCRFSCFLAATLSVAAHDATDARPCERNAPRLGLYLPASTWAVGCWSAAGCQPGRARRGGCSADTQVHRRQGLGLSERLVLTGNSGWGLSQLRQGVGLNGLRHRHRERLERRIAKLLFAVPLDSLHRKLPTWGGTERMCREGSEACSLAWPCAQVGLSACTNGVRAMI